MKINILNLTIDSLGFIMSKNERHEVSAGILVYRIVDNEIPLNFNSLTIDGNFEIFNIPNVICNLYIGENCVFEKYNISG
jgi:hypothetical protein